MFEYRSAFEVQIISTKDNISRICVLSNLPLNKSNVAYDCNLDSRCSIKVTIDVTRKWRAGLHTVLLLKSSRSQGWRTIEIGKKRMKSFRFCVHLEKLYFYLIILITSFPYGILIHITHILVQLLPLTICVRHMT